MEIGVKIKRLRLALNLTQEELADRTELSKSFISQVERDLTSPSIATLVDILQALGTDLKEFFGDVTDSQVVFHDADYFEKIDDELGNKTEWIIPNAQKNQMEPIRVTIRPGGKTYIDDPHEGEEFGYQARSPSLYRGSRQGGRLHHLGEHSAQLLMPQL